MNLELFLKIPGETDYLTKIREFITHFAEDLGFSEKEIAEIEMAVDEVCANIVEHGYGKNDIPEDQKTIEILAKVYEDRVEITIKDNAPPFDPTKAPMPNPEEHARKGIKRGLGLFVIRKFTDELKYKYENGNILTLIKYRRKKHKDGSDKS